MIEINEDATKFIIARLLESAKETVQESKGKTGDAFYAGKKSAYYEMLSILQSELDVHDEPLSDFGLDIDLLKNFL
ncbi:hypothetical protein QUW13_03000 [Enterococcus hirae]|nr:hypothetical protein [Enterococcus hirae]